VDYTASKVLRQRTVLDQIPSDPPANLVLTLADENVGLLPQLTTYSACRLTHEIADRGWHGFATRFWILGDLDPVAACIARAAWDRDVVAADSTRRQTRRVCGARAAAPLARALEIVEEVTRRLDEHGMGVGFPVPGMLMGHWDGTPLAPAFRQDRDDYERALRLAQAARRVSRAGGERYVDYYVGRLGFAVEYLRAVDSLHDASLAHGEGDRAGAVRLAREALGRLRRSIEQWADAARDGPDLGAIATLNALAYWPLREHLALLGGS